jgi:quercetin dioxygenase-like cupin family protein
MDSKSKVLKSSGFSWKGVQKKQYKTDTLNFKNIHRYSLLGNEFQELNFQTRYFEVQPGGFSSLEMHRHPHSVIVIRGKGSLILENEIHSLALHDVVYVSPETIHQFHADQDEPLGFICIVDRYRDRPIVPDDETIKSRITNPKVLQKIRK